MTAFTTDPQKKISSVLMFQSRERVTKTAKHKPPKIKQRSPIQLCASIKPDAPNPRTAEDTMIKAAPANFRYSMAVFNKIAPKIRVIIGTGPFIKTPPCAAGAKMNPEKTVKM